MIAKVIAANNAGSKLAASILATDTSLTLTAGEGASFASPTAGNYATITLSDQGTGLIREIMWYTARSGDTLSGLQRGKEGTTARAWAVYDPVEELFTAGQMAKMAQDPSDQLGGVSAVQTYAGNPNGNVAGNAAVAGGLPPSQVWDTTNKIFWTCTTTGTIATAVWIPATVPGQTTYAGTSGGTANALTLNPAVPVALSPGVAVSFIVGTSNTGAATMNVSGTGVIAIRKNSRTGPAATAGGEMVAGNTATLRYNGTFWSLEVTTLGTASLADQSSITGKVAAVSGSVVSGHAVIFGDNQGTVVDGGPAGVGGAPFPLNPGNTPMIIGPGVYFVDTSTGPVSVTTNSAPTAGSGYTFIDQRATWGTNNFTVNMPSGINVVCNGITTQGVVGNLSGWEFTLEFDGTNMGAL